MNNHEKWNNSLKNLVAFSGDIEQTKEELAEIDWDYQPKEKIFLEISDIDKVLQKYFSGQLKAKEIEAWANLVEGRESLSYPKEEEEKINKLIFYLANPEINKGIEKEEIDKILSN